MTNEQLINDLVKEDRDTTIKDYLSVRSEIRAVYDATEKRERKERIERMNKYDALIAKIDETLNIAI